MAEWPSDQDLEAAANRLAAKLLEMYNLDWPFDPNQPLPESTGIRARIDGFRRDHEGFLLFDPQKIIDEYDRMLSIAKRTGDNPHLVADFNETRRHLDPWTGDAAIAFDRQLSLMSEYCELQQTNIGQALQGLLMMGQLAIHARFDYLELAEATIAAADKEISGGASRDAAAAVTVVSEIVDGVIDLNPATVLANGLSMLTKVSTELAKDAIEGDDREDIVNNYCHYRNTQRSFYASELQRVVKFLNARLNEVVRDGHPLREPLPAYCDVDSPDFSYERFYPTRDTTPATSAPTVADERQKYAEEKQRSDTEITRRLGGDRGAV